MKKLKGSQRKYLRGVAHSLTPLVLIGQKGVTEGTIIALKDALDLHEIVKIKFNEHKEEKKTLVKEIEESLGTESIGMIGHTAIFYLQHPDPEKRKIELPE